MLRRTVDGKTRVVAVPIPHTATPRYVFGGIILLFLLLAAAAASAQSPTPVAQFLNSQSTQDQAHARKLLTETNPSVYLKNGSAQTIGNRPVCLFTDAASLSSLQVPGFPKGGIELITIKIENPSELSATVDLSDLTLYPKLKYIYIVSETQTTASVLSGIVQNAPADVTLIYAISNTR